LYRKEGQGRELPENVGTLMDNGSKQDEKKGGSNGQDLAALPLPELLPRIGHPIVAFPLSLSS
jgi:hypothetical protein